MIFTAASGPVSISCLDPDNQGNEPCADFIFYGGSGPLDIVCNGIYACEFATYNLGSGSISIVCDQSDACNPTAINGGTGTVNLTCGAVPAGQSDSCAGLTKNQNNAIITETDAKGTSG